MPPKVDILEEYAMTDEEVKAAENKIDADMILEEQKRAEIAKRAPVLSKKFVEGTDYREKDIIKLKNGEYVKVFIRPLTEDSIYESFDNIGVKELPSATRGVRLSQIKNARLAVELAMKAIILPKGLSPDQLKVNVEYGELTRIGSNILAKMFNRETVETETEQEGVETAGFS